MTVVSVDVAVQSVGVVLLLLPGVEVLLDDCVFITKYVLNLWL